MSRPARNGSRVTAVEIIRQASQGYSVKPFIIRADDKQTYFVKGIDRAGRSALVSEALAAELGLQLKLPIPPWRVMDIPQELIDFSMLENVGDLRGGPAFASMQVPNSADLLVSSVNSIPAELQRLVLIFDWWILNGDRALSELGGNVNLLLDGEGELTVIDHNAAFDSDVTAQTLLLDHVFRDAAADLRDMVTGLEYQQKLELALRKWSRITSVLPADWVYRNEDHTDPTSPTLKQRLATLERIANVKIWEEL